MTTHSTVYVDNDSILLVESLRDRNGDLVTTATVTLDSLVDKNGDAVSGVDTPSELTHVGDGTYELTIPSTASFVSDRIYRATVKAVTVSGLIAEWTERLIAKRRAA